MLFFQGKTGTFHNQQDGKDPSGEWRDESARKLNMVRFSNMVKGTFSKSHSINIILEHALQIYK